MTETEQALESQDTYPLWTIRYTWQETEADGKPMHTYVHAGTESEAIDRAVFALDHHQNHGANVLACAHIRRPDCWSEVSGAAARLARHEHLYAFQRPPTRLP